MIEIEKILEYDIIQIAWLLLVSGLVIALYYYFYKYKSLQREYLSQRRQLDFANKENDSLKIINSDYVRIVERSNDGIAICYKNIIEFVNDSGAAILERNVQNIENRHIDSFIAEDAKTQFMEIFAGVMNDNDSSAFVETEFDLGWGEIKYIEMSLTHILFSGKGALLAIFRDVTPRKRIEKKLKDNEILYRNLFEHAGDAIFIMDGNEFVDCNKKTLDMFRCSKAQIMQKAPYMFSPERQYNGELSKVMAIKHIRAAVEGKKQHFTWLHKRFDEELFHAEVSLSLLPLEDKNYILAIVRDIDDKEKYKRQIEESHTFMTNLLDSIPSPVAYLDEDCKVKHSNIKFDEVFAEVSEDSEKNYKLPSELKHCTNTENQLKDQTHLIKYEYDDGCSYYQTYIRKIKRGDDFGFLVLLFDITEKISKQNELEKVIEELNVARAEIAQEAQRAIELNDKLLQSEHSLKELNTMKDKFFSIIAHDLRNPLNVFHGITSFVKDRYNELSSEEIEESINDLSTSADKLLNLLENLLSWARSQTGSMEFCPENTDLGELAMTVEYLFKESAKKKGIRIVNNIPTNYYLKADRNMLSTIIRNLTSNAIKFTERGGSVTLDAEKDIYNTYIKITDTGVGIEEKIIDKLFNPGEKISTKGTSSESGTGLGLLMVKEFTDRHSGEIEVKSSKDEGSVFTVTIPLNQEGSQ